MNALWQHFWQQRSPQEQRTLSLAAAALLLMLGYQFLWSPIQQAARNAETRLQEAQALAAFTAQARHTLTGTRPSAATANPAQIRGAPLVWLGQQAKTAGIADHLKDQQITPDGIQLSFDGVNFDAFIRWLGSVHAAGFRVLRSDIHPSGAGLAHLRLTLSAPDAS